VYTGVGVKPEGERSLGIRTYRWKGNIKVYVQGIECEKVWNGIIWLRMGAISKFL
jgi:hypothetical protein